MTDSRTSEFTIHAVSPGGLICQLMMTHNEPCLASWSFENNVPLTALNETALRHLGEAHNEGESTA